METIKVKNIKTGVVKNVNISLASDYIGTGEYEIYKEINKEINKEVTKTPNFKFSISKDKNNDK